MVKRYLTRKRKQLRRKSRKFISRRHRVTTKRRQQQRGGSLPIPAGAVGALHLDPSDEYGVPVLVRKEIYEEEVEPKKD